MNLVTECLYRQVNQKVILTRILLHYKKRGNKLQKRKLVDGKKNEHVPGKRNHIWRSHGMNLHHLLQIRPTSQGHQQSFHRKREEKRRASKRSISKRKRLYFVDGFSSEGKMELERVDQFEIASEFCISTPKFCVVCDDDFCVSICARASAWKEFMRT